MSKLAPAPAPVFAPPASMYDPSAEPATPKWAVDIAAKAQAAQAERLKRKGGTPGVVVKPLADTMRAFAEEASRDPCPPPAAPTTTNTPRSRPPAASNLTAQSVGHSLETMLSLAHQAGLLSVPAYQRLRSAVANELYVAIGVEKRNEACSPPKP